MNILTKVGHLIVEPLIKTVEVNNRSLVLSHYSLRNWQGKHHDSWHLFGHSHGKLEPHGLSFDVGVDAHDFYPWTWDEVCEKMNSIKNIF
jgi:calcineurin-like phosphoesterase family protein